MPDKQLQVVANWEKDKEQKFAQDFQIAQQHVLQNQEKLKGLEQYRLDYLRLSQQKAMAGLGAQSFNQHQSFIGKLDKACEQQTQMLSQSKQVAEQRKNQWLQQQRKRKAVEMLLAKKKLQRQKRQDRAEQQLLDELATQKFVRKKTI